MTKKKVIKRRRILTTPRSQVRSNLRLLFMRSRERAMALKSAGYCCSICGVKHSKAKGREVTVEVHHPHGSGIDEIIDLVFKRLLCSPEEMVCLCKACHALQHGKADQ